MKFISPLQINHLQKIVLDFRYDLTTVATIAKTPGTQDDKINHIVNQSKYIDKYGGLCVLIVGTIGNSFTLLILSQKSMRQYTINICLVTMTTADLVHTMVGQMGRHMVRGFFGTDPTSLSAAYCKIWYCLAGYTVIYSTYILVGKST